MFLIREENPEDINSISETNKKAFGRDDEAKLVETLRSREEMILSLVGVLEDEIIGYIGFSRVEIHDGVGEPKIVAGLAPMAVIPSCQEKGYGARLIATGLEMLKEQGYCAVVVLGHPEYYPRFGFVPSVDYDIKCTYECPEEAFMIKILRPDQFTGTKGVAHFCSSFSSI